MYVSEGNTERGRGRGRSTYLKFGRRKRGKEGEGDRGEMRGEIERVRGVYV